VAGRSFSTGGVAAWVDEALGGLSAPAWFAARGEAPGSPAALTLRPRILKAYVDSLAVTKTAVVVLEVDLAGPSGPAETRRYRGQHASMNWASGEDEVRNGLHAAMADAAQKLSAEVDAWLTRGQAPGPAAQK
jgi:hypothetical protein